MPNGFFTVEGSIECQKGKDTRKILKKDDPSTWL